MATNDPTGAPVELFRATRGPLVLIPRGKASGSVRPGKLVATKGNRLEKRVATGDKFFPAKSATFSARTVVAILAHYARIGAAQEPPIGGGAAFFAALQAGQIEVPALERAERSGGVDPMQRAESTIAAWEAEYASEIAAALAEGETEDADADTDGDTDDETDTGDGDGETDASDDDDADDDADGENPPA